MSERTGMVLTAIEPERRTSMYTATFIDDLVAPVERAQACARIRAEQPNSRNWFAVAPAVGLAAAAQLPGVA